MSHLFHSWILKYFGFYLMYKLICQKSVLFYLPKWICWAVFIVLEMYNFATAQPLLLLACCCPSFFRACAQLWLDHLGSFRIVFFFDFVLFIFFLLFLLYRNCTRGLASYAAVLACHACYIDKKSAVINFLSLVSVFSYTADTTETLKRKTILISTLWFCLFVRNRGDTIQYHSGPRSRELGQAPKLLDTGVPFLPAGVII